MSSYLGVGKVGRVVVGGNRECVLMSAAFLFRVMCSK